MLVFVGQVFNFLPVPFEELYADGRDFLGVEYWYNKAVAIDRKNAAAAKVGKR